MYNARMYIELQLRMRGLVCRKARVRVRVGASAHVAAAAGGDGSDPAAVDDDLLVAPLALAGALVGLERVGPQVADLQPLEVAPEVLHRIRVDRTVHVHYMYITCTYSRLIDYIIHIHCMS